MPDPTLSANLHVSDIVKAKLNEFIDRYDKELRNDASRGRDITITLMILKWVRAGLPGDLDFYIKRELARYTKENEATKGEAPPKPTQAQP